MSLIWFLWLDRNDAKYRNVTMNHNRIIARTKEKINSLYKIGTFGLNRVLAKFLLLPKQILLHLYINAGSSRIRKKALRIVDSSPEMVDIELRKNKKSSDSGKPVLDRITHNSTNNLYKANLFKKNHFRGNTCADFMARLGADLPCLTCFDSSNIPVLLKGLIRVDKLGCLI
ncbi:hypothetical protein M5K25_012042 [Dendrobium thyrsiflorum]|uniref:Uncharacterized protein n=1 Tax=Dendrobium thyrsiflorum TaxID=117978 RepID=A0ABD0UWQ8_DENTH